MVEEKEADRELDVMIDQTDRLKGELFRVFSSGFGNEMKEVKRQKVPRPLEQFKSFRLRFVFALPQLDQQLSSARS